MLLQIFYQLLYCLTDSYLGQTLLKNDTWSTPTEMHSPTPFTNSISISQQNPSHLFWLRPFSQAQEDQTQTTVTEVLWGLD